MFSDREKLPHEIRSEKARTFDRFRDLEAKLR